MASGHLVRTLFWRGFPVEKIAAIACIPVAEVERILFVRVTA